MSGIYDSGYSPAYGYELFSCHLSPIAPMHTMENIIVQQTEK